MEDKDRPLVIYYKKADKTTNRIILPKFYIEKYGRNFYLEVYSNGELKIKPIKEKEK